MAMTRETSGKTIAACGTAETAARLANGLVAAGLSAHAFALVKLEPVQGWIGGLEFDSFDWIVLVSPTAARITLGAIGGIYTGKIACIGVTTAEVVRASGFSVAIIPAEQNRKGLQNAMARQPRGRLLLPQGDAAPDELAAGLTKLGFKVSAPLAYSNVPDDAALREFSQALEAGELKAAAFTSSSAVEHATLAGDLGGVRIYCIGASTASTARELGLEPTGVARRSNVSGLVSTIVEGERG